MKQRFIIFFTICVISVFSAGQLLAATPSGNDWFQLLTDHATGGDNTGDGGTGLASDLNYYYVGQTFNTDIDINVDTLPGISSANIWIDYQNDYVTASGLSTGSYFPNWSSQNIINVAGTLNRVRSTGYRTTGTSSGNGDFGNVDFTMVHPTEANYGEGSPQTLDINIGVVGATTESNLSYLGNDLLDDAEDFQFHIWADTKRPYAQTPNPFDTETGVAIDVNYLFELRDSKNGEGNDSGVGTGVNISTPPGVITANDGGGAVDYTVYDAYSCSGIWGTNLCNVTLNPPSPLGIAGDTRNWKYDTLYTMDINSFQDQASAAQDQLGDTNGPNTMLAKTWTFRTEPDIVAPRVTSETPTRGSVGVSVSTNITVEVTDRKVYPNGPSGTGVNSVTCRINVSSPSVPLFTYQEGQAMVTVTAIDYGYRFVIDPPTDFAQNEIVSVSVYDCQDIATIPNTMVTDNYTFMTADSDPPYVDTENPADNAVIALDGVVTFHVKDDGVGVDLNDTVIYVNGQYFTNGGGAGAVTIQDTRITFATSSDYNGGNFVGDTTSIVGTANDYTLTIDLENDFVADEVVPVIIYAQDLSNNIMERHVYGLLTSSGGGFCPLGSTYCGLDTTWNGVQCIGSGGTCTTGGGGGGHVYNISNVTVTQIDEQSVLVSWTSNKRGSAKVLYDTVSPTTLGTEPNYSYTYSTEKYDDDSIYHSVVIDNLETGTLYYFRPYTDEIRGPEVKMAPVFAQVIIEYEPVQCDAPLSSSTPISIVIPNSSIPSFTSSTTSPIQFRIQTLDGEEVNLVDLQPIIVDNKQKIIHFSGQGAPLSEYQLIVY